MRKPCYITMNSRNGWKTMWKLLERKEKLGNLALGLVLFAFLILGMTRADQKSDFLDYYHASKRWVTGENLYRFDVALQLTEIRSLEELFQPQNLPLLQALQNETATYIYPPLFSFLLIPLGALSPYLASLIFQIISWLALLGIVWLLLKDKNSIVSQMKLPGWTFTLLLLLNFRFLESHIQNNQVGILLIFLILISILSEKDTLSGFLLALAVSIKVTPLVFLFLFIYQRRFKAIGYFVISILFWNLLPCLYNFNYTMQMTNTWFSEILGNAMSNPMLRSWKNNQSFVSTMAKYFLVGADFINQPSYNLPFLQLSKETIKYIQLIFVGLFGLPLLFLLKKKGIQWEILSLLFLFSAIFSGISWTHSFVICLVPYLLILFYHQTNRLSKMESYVLAVVTVLPLLSHRNFIGPKFESALSMFSILLYTSSILYFIILKMAYTKDANRN